MKKVVPTLSMPEKDVIGIGIELDQEINHAGKSPNSCRYIFYSSTYVVKS